MKTKQLFISLTLGLGLTLALLRLLQGSPLPVAQAQSGTRFIHVALTGNDVHNCGPAANPCRTVQYAVGRAGEGDEIHVATGIYTDVNVRPRNDITTTGVVTQVVYISQTVTIRGGYNANFSAWDPNTYTTTLNARRQGRVIYITGDISPTIEGLRITGGDATGLGGYISPERYSYDAGGGVYVITAGVTISNNQLFSNTAHLGGGLFITNSAPTLSGNIISANIAISAGGGLDLRRCPTATLSDNIIISNTAKQGGGLYMWRSSATLNGNTFISNTVGQGGGLFLYRSSATLNGNTFISNTANNFGGGLRLADHSSTTLSYNTIALNTATEGGGLYLANNCTATLSFNNITTNTAEYGGGLNIYTSTVTLSDNKIISNTAGQQGGGLYLDGSTVTLSDNKIISNTAGQGGGLFLHKEITVTLNGNKIISNTAGQGGGLFLYKSTATLISDTILSNTAHISGGGLRLADHSTAMLSGVTITANIAITAGGGLFLRNFCTATLTNTIIADNRLSVKTGTGAGLHIEGSSARLLHTTIARNSGGDGSGVHVTEFITGGEKYYSTVALTNTILVSHEVGITVTAGNTVTVNGVLWHNTPITVSKATTAMVTVQKEKEYKGDPAFAPDGYHLTTGSAAIDRGVNAGVTTDIDGELRPAGTTLPDLGADEFQAALSATKQPSVIKASVGETITYTYMVTNTGGITLTAVSADDNLLGPIRLGTTTLAPGQITTGTATYVVQKSDLPGPLTNTVTVTGTSPVGDVVKSYALEGVDLMAIEVVKQASPDPVQAGQQLTYTLRITNAGNVDLHATVTDTLPAHVAPTGTLTWTPVITAPGGVWTRQVVVTVNVDYAGLLTNVLKVTTGEGATDVYTETSEARVTPMLEVTKEAEPDLVQAGEQLTYTIHVTNTGNMDLHATITDTLPAYVTPTGILTWTPTITAPGGVWTQQVVITVEMGYAGTLTNVVEVTTNEGATGVYTGTSTSLKPAIAIDKDPSVDTAKVGETITYTYMVTNTGSVTLTAVSADDNRLGAISPATTLSPGDITTGTATYVVQENDLPGPLTNIATVTGTPPTGPDVTATCTASVALTFTPAIEVDKEPSVDTAYVGETITYTYTVTNTGNVSLHDIRANDDRRGPISLDTNTLGPDETTTGTATYTVVAGDLFRSPLVNVVTVTGTSRLGDVVTDTDDTSVDLERFPICVPAPVVVFLVLLGAAVLLVLLSVVLRRKK